MAKKKIPIASVRKALLKNPPSNVTIIDPETDEVTTTSDTTTKSMSFIPLNKKGEPIPQSKGTGRKQCPSCGCFIAPVAAVCPNPSCKHIFVKGEKPVKGTRTPKTPAIEQAENPKVSLLKVLKSRGFEVSGTRDIFDPTAEIQYSTEKAIAPILDFVPSFNRNGKFELSLDDMLTILKLPLSK
jgi:hypothetical protein